MQGNNGHNVELFKIFTKVELQKRLQKRLKKAKKKAAAAGYDVYWLSLVA